MRLGLTPVGRGPEQFIPHDLNFGTPRYEVEHDLVQKTGHNKGILANGLVHRYSRTPNLNSLER